MVDALRGQGRFHDPVARGRAGQALAACEAARLLVYRAVDRRARGSTAGVDASLARTAVVSAEHAVADFAVDFLPDTLTGTAFALHLAHHERAIASGIASGAAEIQLNLIARDHLQLPREAHS
jgi:alkylation response protein AidB-like acyl-CoA dehydrogenase